jgi:hypothetical protein
MLCAACGPWLSPSTLLLQEDARLIAGHAKHGNKWTLIAQLVGGRTDNAVKNRWAALCKKQASRRARGSDTSGDDADSQHAPRYSKDQPEVMGPHAAMIGGGGGGSAAAAAVAAAAAAAAAGQPRRAAAAARHYDVYEGVSDSSTGSPAVRGSHPSNQQQQQLQAQHCQQQQQQQQAYAAQHMQSRQPTAGGCSLAVGLACLNVHDCRMDASLHPHSQGSPNTLHGLQWCSATELLYV